MLEKRLSANSVMAYMGDAEAFVAFARERYEELDLTAINRQDIEDYIQYIHKKGVKQSSQARAISGVKSLFSYLYLYDKISSLPTDLIEMPKIGRKLPTVLTQEEVVALISAIDMSQPMAHRNRAMVELLYSCGLRVSELVELKMRDLFLEDNYIRVIGKGDKQRLIPISGYAIDRLKIYLEDRASRDISSREEHLFLGRYGRKLTRVMVFIIIKDLASKAGITKSISPHTLRHTFATHMVRGGSDIRLVQMMMGHQSITTTDIYTHLDNQYLRDNIERYHPLAKLKAQ